MSELPQGWVKTDLQTVATWGSGGTPKAGTAAYYGGEIPWAVIGDLTDGPVSATRSTITELGLSNSSAKVVSADCVLIAMYGSIGKLGLPTIPLATNQAIAFARPRAGVLARKYLFFYLLSQRDRLSSAGKGATQQNISQTILRSWPIQLPPLAEQRRIVAAIEEHFSRLDAGGAALERVRQKLKRMRAAVLQAAVEAGDAERDERVRLGDVLREPLRNGYSAKAAGGGSIRIWTLTAVTDGDFGLHNSKLTSADPRRVRDLWVQPNDLLIERSNTPELVGTARVYTGPPNVAVYPDLVIRARLSDSILPKYAEVMLQAPTARRYFQRRAQGISGSMPKIDQTAIQEFSFPLPPPDSQARIIERVVSRVALIEMLYSSLAIATSRSSRLRSSLLASAFSGELVPQNPNDEPASVLLQRIADEPISGDCQTAARPRKTPATSAGVLAT